MSKTKRSEDEVVKMLYRVATLEQLILENPVLRDHLSNLALGVGATYSELATTLQISKQACWRRMNPDPGQRIKARRQATGDHNEHETPPQSETLPLG